MEEELSREEILTLGKMVGNYKYCTRPSGEIFTYQWRGNLGAFRFYINGDHLTPLNKTKTYVVVTDSSTDIRVGSIKKTLDDDVRALGRHAEQIAKVAEDKRIAGLRATTDSNLREARDTISQA